MRQPALLEHWNFCKDHELNPEGMPEKRLRGGLLRLNTRVLRCPIDKANKGFPLSDCHLQRLGQIDICSLPDMLAKRFSSTQALIVMYGFRSGSVRLAFSLRMLFIAVDGFFGGGSCSAF